jgi:hypothetical protein
MHQQRFHQQEYFFFFQDVIDEEPVREVKAGGRDGGRHGGVSRLSLRKGRSVVHKNLEDNYGAVISANHEALAQILEQVGLFFCYTYKLPPYTLARSDITTRSSANRDCTTRPRHQDEVVGFLITLIDVLIRQIIEGEKTNLR